MRKVAFIAATAVAAAVAIAVPASAIDGEQAIAIKVTPSSHGTSKKPKNVKLKVTTTTKPAAGQAAFATTQAVLYFDKNLVFGGSKFKSCTVAAVQASESSCPAGSKVGSGSATGVAIGQTENLTVTAFNGPKGKTLLLHVVGTAPLAIDSVIEAKLGKASGKFGTKLTVPIPASLQQPVTGVYATLTSFITNVSGKVGSTPYVGLVGCPKTKKMSFKGTFTYTDGTSKTATTTVKCS